MSDVYEQSFIDSLIGRTGKLTHSPVWIGLSDSKVTVQWGGGGGGYLFIRKEGNVLFNESLIGRNGKLTHSPVWIGLSDSKVTVQWGGGGGGYLFIRKEMFYLTTC